MGQNKLAAEDQRHSLEDKAKGLGFSSVVEHLPMKPKGLGSVLCSKVKGEG